MILGYWCWARAQRCPALRREAPAAQPSRPHFSFQSVSFSISVDSQDEPRFPFLIAPLLGGWIADRQGFEITFAASGLLSIVMMGILSFLIQDPLKLQKDNP
jgi:hypothetical protein